MSAIVVATFMAFGMAVGVNDGTCNPARGEACDVAESVLLQTRAQALRKLRALRDDEREIIVQYKNENGKIACDKADARGHSWNMPNLHGEVVVLNKTALKALQENPNIDSVAPNSVVQAMVHHRGEPLSLEAMRDEQTPWGIGAVQADLLAPGEHSVTVCVVDTGYGVGHPDLPTPADHGVNGTDTQSGKWNEDGHGHGSHCAGTIGAIGDNAVGVRGVIQDPAKFRFHIGKGLSNSGSGTTAGVMEAVDGCLSTGAARVVISMSLGGGGFASAIQNEYREAYEQGALIIAAAGNGASSAFSYPASYPFVMSVAATDSAGNKASFSQYNSQVEIAGPGVGVLSTINSSSGFSYASWSGTSMATPHVAGVAALVWSHFPNCTNHQIRNVLLMTAEDKGPTGCDAEYGYGIVKAKAAYDLITASGCEVGGNPDNVSAVSPGGCEQYMNCPDSGCTTPAPPPFVGACESGESGKTFKVLITGDRYPAENAFSITDSTGVTIASVPANGIVTGENEPWNYCLPQGTYTFTITDTWGDGMCCGYGQGSYSLVLDGSPIHSGGQFNRSEATEFVVELNC